MLKTGDLGEIPTPFNQRTTKRVTPELCQANNKGNLQLRTSTQYSVVRISVLIVGVHSHRVHTAANGLGGEIRPALAQRQ